MSTIAHVKIPYLPLSETFIYQRLINLRRYRGLVITDRELQNLDIYPYPKIYHLSEIHNLGDFLLSQGVTAIHAHFGTGGIRVLAAQRKTGLPLLTSFHGVDVSSRPRQNPEYRLQLPQLFTQSTLCAAVSDYMKIQLINLGCPREKIVVIKSGIDLSKFPYSPPRLPCNGSLTLLSIGRLKEKKGMHLLIPAFARLSHLYPKARLLIGGEGGQKKKLMRLVNDLGLAQSVFFLGPLSHQEVRVQLAQATIFVLACTTASDGDQEGIPNVLMEAMASGLPVVAADHTGISELVSQGKTGLLAREGNIQDLAYKMSLLLANTHLWPAMTAAARRKVEQEHDIVKQAAKLEVAYDFLLSANHSGTLPLPSSLK
ncbi:MAG: glycosyltransferase [Clostridia bacterium]|nr:glycosyltransferase [Clostridia bacterium]